MKLKISVIAVWVIVFLWLLLSWLHAGSGGGGASGQWEGGEVVWKRGITCDATEQMVKCTFSVPDGPLSYYDSEWHAVHWENNIIIP